MGVDEGQAVAVMRFRGRPRNYILVDGRPVPEDDIETWARFFEDQKLRVLRQDFFVYKNKSLTLISDKAYAETVSKHQYPWRELTPQEIAQNERAYEKLKKLGGVPIKLSTIFLGTDHNHYGEGPPVLWETMMFGINHNEFGQHRYVSAEDAIAGHLLLLQTLVSVAKAGKLENLLPKDADDEATGEEGR
jgi:hypothetical protein